VTTAPRTSCTKREWALAAHTASNVRESSAPSATELSGRDSNPWTAGKANLYPLYVTARD
jgi:hypothetical protein